MTHTLLAVDPGKTHAGVAFFCNRNLVSAQLITAASPFEVARHVEMWVWLLRDKLPKGTITSSGKLNVLVTEGQQIYPGVRAQNPNDLLPLAYVCGAVQARIDAFDRLMPFPREWKGSVPKEVFTRRILQRLDHDALKIISGLKCPAAKKHNVIDAVGLGLWGLGVAPEKEGEHDVH